MYKGLTPLTQTFLTVLLVLAPLVSLASESPGNARIAIHPWSTVSDEALYDWLAAQEAQERLLLDPDTVPYDSTEDKLKYWDKLGHWFESYGYVQEDFLAEELKAFKRAAFANVYLEPSIRHKHWMFWITNKITRAKNPQKTDPHIVFQLEFVPANDEFTSYGVQLSLKGSPEVAGQLAAVQSKINTDHLSGLSGESPAVFRQALTTAFQEAFTQLAEALGNSLAPPFVVSYGDELLLDGDQVRIFEGMPEVFELQTLDKDLQPLDDRRVSWQNATKSGSTATVSLAGISRKEVSVSYRGYTSIITFVKQEDLFDIKTFLKEQIIAVLQPRKEKDQDTLRLYQDDLSELDAELITQLGLIEKANLPLEASTEITAAPVFTEPVLITDSSTFLTNETRTKGFQLLRQKKGLEDKVRKRINILAFADLVVEQPDALDDLADGIIRNSGRLLAQIMFDQSTAGQEDRVRNLVIDYLNANIEKLAGNSSVAVTAVPLQLPVVEIADPPAINLSESLVYMNPLVPMTSAERDAFQTEMNSYLQGLEEKVFVNIRYSQDVSDDSYQSRISPGRPAGLPADYQFVNIDYVNIPGSVKAQIIGSNSRGTVAPGLEYTKTSSVLLSLAQLLAAGSGAAAYYYDADYKDIWIRNLHRMACASTNDEGLIEILVDYSVRDSKFVYGLRGKIDFDFHGIDLIIDVDGLPARGSYLVDVSSETVVRSGENASVSYKLINTNSEFRVFLKTAKLNSFSQAIHNSEITDYQQLVDDIPDTESDEAYSKLVQLPVCGYELITIENRLKYLGWLAGEFWTNADQEELIINLIKTVPVKKELFDKLYQDPNLLGRLMLQCDGDNRSIFIDEIANVCDKSWPKSPKIEHQVSIGTVPDSYDSFYRGNYFITYAKIQKGESSVVVVNYIGRFPKGLFDWGNTQVLLQLPGFDANLLDPVTIISSDGTTAIFPLIYAVNVSEELGNREVLAQFTASLNYIGVFSAVRVLATGTRLAKTLAIVELTKTGLEFIIEDPQVMAKLQETEDGREFLKWWQIASVTIDLATVGADVLEGLVKNGTKSSSALREIGKTDAADNIDQLVDEAELILSGSSVLSGLLKRIDGLPNLKAWVNQLDNGTVINKLDGLSTKKLSKLERDLATSNGASLKGVFNSNPETVSSWSKFGDSPLRFNTEYLEYISTLRSSWKIRFEGSVTKILDGSGNELAEISNNMIKAKGGTKANGDWNKLLNQPPMKNQTYQVDNYVYKTDADGRVKSVSGQLENVERGRLNSQQTGSVSLKDGIDGDEGGHLIANILNGPGEQINYLPQTSKLNNGAWKDMEMLWKNALRREPNPATVRVDIRPIFEGASKRPVAFEVDYWIDGIKKSEFFDN